MLNRASTLRAEEITGDLARAWDELVVGRGLQADVFDTHAWAGSWLGSRPERAEHVRVVGVFDGARPLALLPLELGPGGRAREIGRGQRERTRVVFGTEQPRLPLIQALVEEIGRSGVRELSLTRMPSRDPATLVFVEALRAAGFAVDVREHLTDMIESTPDGWAAYRDRHRGFDGAIGQTWRRAVQLWPLRVAAFGAPGTPPITAGLADHEELFDLSWKGRLGASPDRRRRLLRALDARGLARLYVLYAADRAIGSCTSVRIGAVVHWHTVAYDPSVAMLGAGNIVHWRAQELAFDEGPLALIDLLPGASPLKDRISSERPALLDVCAARVPARVLPILRGARELQRALPIATRARAHRLRDRLARPTPTSPGTVRRLEARPATTEPATPCPELALNPRVLRLLAVACARKGPKEMQADWGVNDIWYRVGDAPAALARVDTGEPVATLREVVRYDPNHTLEAIALMLADLLAAPVRYLDEVPVRDPRLRWPAGWTTPAEPAPTHAPDPGRPADSTRLPEPTRQPERVDRPATALTRTEGA
ncbi:GNAT family N-acetyltransferase [Streptomyces sp. SID3343]|uniref:GNAT family N-acetyltransferase n=1 Tax=Streptomyces sp. SID3343 TaxID=2690260 RepID=UPI00136EB803|nr:GNAT family N-acetyltransferase [Streptomyces sp. SID3343]MYV98446.1 GNAT family N-acetyltransferase [Streptomyces sp. SID3343]